ncbi:heme utilization cystosolic carrier protein HutX [Crenobacter intestini]|uniref:Heme utilization cystosolic carrier protein HutX n=1 Tax=Crenobacter intestini TaxID=2563443 RepID=A0A4V6TSX8_9NEIS|nr:heme utilization cystosolic carrier protein HutX [Crenobacter intestini]TIC83713.1 heme utilization cystosolic carrier protein HutX [Crenobacter intestini]
MNDTPFVQMKERLARNPGVVLEKLAEGSNLTMAQLIECLPEAMWRKVDGRHCVAVLEALPALGDVTVIMHTADGIFEIGGAFPAGETGHGFYNLHGKQGLHGHLRAGRCQAVYLVERPFMGRDSASLLFANGDGGVMFKVFAGREADGSLKQSQLAALHALMAAHA